jgi:hypothetical protein
LFSEVSYRFFSGTVDGRREKLVANAIWFSGVDEEKTGSVAEESFGS